jgi:hypothetical protein
MAEIIKDGNITYSIPTPEELDASAKVQMIIDAQKAKAKQIADIQAQLDAIDLKSIRAIRTNDTARMAQWEAQAQALRAQLEDIQ